MQTFFHGWRRKTGCVTLVMACVFMTLWFRSSMIFDDVAWNTPLTQYGILSFENRLCFSIMSADSTRKPFTWHTGLLSRMSHNQPDKNGIKKPFRPMESASWKVEWRRDWGEFHQGVGEFQAGPIKTRRQSLIIPYWSVVLPQAVLSTYLILWKPRKRSGTVTGVMASDG